MKDKSHLLKEIEQVLEAFFPDEDYVKKLQYQNARIEELRQAWADEMAENRNLRKEIDRLRG